MARLPTPGGDNGNWGNILNDYLSQALDTDGTIKDNAVTANTLAPNSVTNAAIAPDAVNAVSVADGSITNALIADGTIAEAKLAPAVQTKLNNSTAPVSSVAGKTGAVTLVAADISNATTTGKSLLTAADSATARRAIAAQDEAASGAMRSLMSKLTRGVTDAAWVNVGDSTGNEQTEWVYLTAQWLAARFPAYSVRYYLWDAPALANPGLDNGYQAVVTVQTGTGTANAGGPFTLTVWNASVAGSTTGYFQGSRFDAAFTGKNADLLTISYGHNQGGPVNTDSTIQFQRNKYLAFMDEYTASSPLAGVVCILQNPSIENPSAAPGRPYAWQPQRLEQFEIAARWRGWGVIDVFQAFVANQNWATDYLSADGLHPNSAGEAVWTAQVTGALDRALQVSTTTQPATVSAPGKQLITNPEFASWASTNPDGVSMSTSPALVATKELTDYETSAVAMLLTTDSTSGQPYAQWGGTASSWGVKSIANQVYTLAVRIKAPASNTATVRITLQDNNGSAQSVSTDVDATCRDRYSWIYVTKVFASNATSMFIRVSPRSSGTAVVTCLVDRIYLMPGAIPLPHGGISPLVQIGASSVTFGTNEVQTAAEANMNRISIDGNAYCSNTTGIAIFSYFIAKQNITINNIQAISGSTAAAATPTLCKLAVYSVDVSTGDLTRIGTTASDTTLFAATFTEYTRALSVSVSLTQGLTYAYAVLQVSGVAVATLQGKGGAGLANQHFRAPRLSGLVTGQTDLLATYSGGVVGAKSGVPYICGTT